MISFIASSSHGLYLIILLPKEYKSSTSLDVRKQLKSASRPAQQQTPFIYDPQNMLLFLITAYNDNWTKTMENDRRT